VGGLEVVERVVPESLQALIAQQFDGLPPTEQGVLEALSVAGLDGTVANGGGRGRGGGRRRRGAMCQPGVAGPVLAGARDGGLAGWDDDGAVWLSAYAVSAGGLRADTIDSQKKIREAEGRVEWTGQ
jgi:hypothetical protein